MFKFKWDTFIDNERMRERERVIEGDRNREWKREGGRKGKAEEKDRKRETEYSCGMIGCHECSYPFTSLDFALTFVQQLEALATRFLKRWSGLPRPENTTMLHLGSSNRAGLHISSCPPFGSKCKQCRWTFWRTRQTPVALGFTIVSLSIRVSGRENFFLQWSMPVLPP